MEKTETQYMPECRKLSKGHSNTSVENKTDNGKKERQLSKMINSKLNKIKENKDLFIG